MKQTYKILFAVAAVLASLFFIVLAGQIYTRLYLGVEDGEGVMDLFRDDLIYHQVIPTMALVTVVIPWTMAAMYYYVINSVHLDRWWHWLILLIITALLTSFGSCRILSSHLAESNYDDLYSSYIFSLSAWNALWGGCFFILSSYGIRWWSGNCRHTPIPQ